MDSLMEINKIPLVYKNHKSNKFICLLQWLDTKIIITDDVNDKITRYELYEFIIINFYNNRYNGNINIVKQVLKIFFMHPIKEQDNSHVFKYVQFRD